MRISGSKLIQNSARDIIAERPILAACAPVVKVLTDWGTPSWFVDLITSFSVITHFEGFQKGVLDSRDILFFLSVIVFSLFSTSVIVRAHRAG